jgi:hypothetical protein
MTDRKRPSLFHINFLHGPQKTPIILDVFRVLLLSTGHGADHIENKSHDSYLASQLEP